MGAPEGTGVDDAVVVELSEAFVSDVAGVGLAAGVELGAGAVAPLFL